MKNKLLFMCMVAIALTACHKPEPEPNNDNPADTTETVVKKYLVKTYYSDPNQPNKIIEWGEGFNRIKRIVTSPGDPYEVDYSFKYENDDQFSVFLTLPEHSWLWYINFTHYICHLREGKITTIDYYMDTAYQYSENYSYDNLGRLISITKQGDHPGANYFEWDGDNVIKIKTLVEGDTVSTTNYGNFCEHIDPESTLPYVLQGHVVAENGFLTSPLWKNWRRTDVDSGVCKHEFDEDGYVTVAYFVTVAGDTIPHTHYVYSN